MHYTRTGNDATTGSVCDGGGCTDGRAGENITFVVILCYSLHFVRSTLSDGNTMRRYCCSYCCGRHYNISRKTVARERDAHVQHNMLQLLLRRTPSRRRFMTILPCFITTRRARTHARRVMLNNDVNNYPARLVRRHKQVDTWKRPKFALSS